MKQEIKNILKQSSVLLVDDDEVLRKHFREFISLYIDKIYEASNGIEALAIFNKQKIDIIFSDIKMPHMNGLALTKKIRKLEPDIPIVIISAYCEQETLLQFIKLHLVEYLIKPVNSQNITEVLTVCGNKLKQNSTNMIKLSEKVFFNNEAKTILIENKTISLSKKELCLLELLIENKDKLVSKQMIEDKVYPDKTMTKYALKNLIFKLRKKLEDENIIATTGSFGYMLNKPNL